MSDSIIIIDKNGCVVNHSVSVQRGQWIKWINEHRSPVVLTRIGSAENGEDDWPWAGTGPYTIPAEPYERCLVIHSGTFTYSVSTCTLGILTNPEIIVADGM